MKKYRVPFTVPVTVYVEVEAEDVDEAIDLAYEEAYLSSYAGNGGYDKLIGVYGDGVSVEADGEPEYLEGSVIEIEK